MSNNSNVSGSFLKEIFSKLSFIGQHIIISIYSNNSSIDQYIHVMFILRNKFLNNYLKNLVKLACIYYEYSVDRMIGWQQFSVSYIT